MGEKKERKNFNVPLPNPAIGDVFRAWCDERNDAYGAVAQAAIQLYMVVPPDLAEMARMGRTEDMRARLDRGASLGLDEIAKRLSDVESRLNKLLGAEAEERLAHVSKGRGESPVGHPAKAGGRGKPASPRRQTG